jgi:hypothetical protein
MLRDDGTPLSFGLFVSQTNRAVDGVVFWIAPAAVKNCAQGRFLD